MKLSQQTGRCAHFAEARRIWTVNRTSAHTSAGMKVVLLALATAVIGCTKPPNLAGRWDVSMKPDFTGKPSLEHCEIQQDGHSIAVRFNGSTSSSVPRGVVNGRTVTWSAHIPDGATASWTGEISASGSSIDGTWQLMLGDGFHKEGQFTAVRATQ